MQLMSEIWRDFRQNLPQLVVYDIFFKIVVSVVMLNMVFACAQVTTRYTTFHRMTPDAIGGAIVVLPAYETLVGSLEFAAYKPKLEAHLAARGYQIAQTVGSDGHAAMVVI